MAAPSNRSEGRSQNLALWIAAGLVALAVVAVFLSFDAPARRAAERRERLAARSGHACGALRLVASALRSGQDRALESTARAADEAAVASLQSGEFRFGKPERTALMIAEEDLEAPIAPQVKGRIEGRLTNALRACSELGR